MSTTEEATVNPDGSTNYDGSGGSSTGGESAADGGGGGDDEEVMPNGIDAAWLLLGGVLAISAIWFFFYFRKRKMREQNDLFFSELDGEKFNLKLPAAVDEYYVIKNKCIDSGWQPGSDDSKKNGSSAAGSAQTGGGPNRVLAQALMKRCIADIPIVTHIQKESPGMNKLYAQSMCSVKQWKAYQAAEAMVSSEVDEVRAEADEIEPGWSNVIWKQAMQYHHMLKQRQDMEAKTMQAQADKKKAEEAKVAAEKKKVDDAKAKELAAEKAAQELIKAEEREKQSKKSFKDGTMKKGFLAAGKKK